MLKFTRGSVIAFDLDEALAFQGESGPYLQYAAVRANNIFDKLPRALTGPTRGLLSPAVAGAAGHCAARRRGRRGARAGGLVLEAARLDLVNGEPVPAGFP